MSNLPRLGLADTPSPQPKPGIVHLGLGAFFRAHGALYLAEAMSTSGGNWGIIGVSLRNPDQRDKLVPQDCVYTVVEQGRNGPRASFVNVVTDVLVAPENPSAVLAAMADRSIHIVSLTVTEKGYCHEPSTGALNTQHPDIIHDLQSPDVPRSAPGFLVQALAMRRRVGVPPFTVLCCDNLPENGHVVRRVVLELARLDDPDLADWIETHVRFPSTMVDRIVPATTPEDVISTAVLTGRQDLSPVMHEPFRQWVVEDDFVDNLRPDLAAVGVQMVQDVAPFEHMKLRCLNGTHSAMAYLGYLAGHQTIADTVADPVFADLCHRLWTQEIVPTLTTPPGVDLPGYTDQLMQRYRNPAIRHATWQIAMDGSQKLPQRILGTIGDNLAADRACPCLFMVVAGWMKYVSGRDESGQGIDVRDPMADTLRGVWQATETVEGRVARFLAMTGIFPPELAADPGFSAGVTSACKMLDCLGSRASVEAILK